MTTRHEILTRLEPIVSKETFEVLSDDSSDEQTLHMYYQSRKDYDDIEKLEETQALNKLEENCSVSPKKLADTLSIHFTRYTTNQFLDFKQGTTH